MHQPADQVSRDKLRRFLRKKDVTVDKIEYLDRHILEPGTPYEQHNRHFQSAPAHQINERGGFAFQTLLPPIRHQTTDRRIGPYRDFRILDLARHHDFKAETLDGDDDLLNAQSFQIVRLEPGS